ncbi:AAA family ATPase [Glycomyces harbinensis]|uniref:AAA domain (Dynein-related subfamily) n=1 Tax=Glycomyces harbinensis TaxID=58114 RepID=A0A1G7B0A5_9ACTN|nr:AAA family ATPase [Glycomyces harbinensis]SDE20382.1 AAA domain (dynein-related subfamily) [Glycomyces harbinensis]
MSPRNSRNQQRKNVPAQQAKGKSAARKDRAADVAAAVDRSGDDSAARKAADGEGVPLPPAAEADAPGRAAELAAQEERLLQALDGLKAQEELYRKSAERAKEREETANERLRDAEAALDENRSERDFLANERQKLEVKAASLREQASALDELERSLIQRESEADSGFPARRAAAEQALQRQLEEARQIGEAAIESRRKALDAELASSAETADRRAKSLDTERAELDERQRNFDDERAALHRDKVMVDRRKQDLDQEVQALAAVALRRLENELIIKEEDAVAATTILKEQSTELTELRNRWASVGVSDPRQLLKDLAAARDQVQELRDELESRPDEASATQLEALRQQNRALNAERERLAYELQVEHGRILSDRISAMRVKQLADAEQQYAVMGRGYEQRIAELSGTLKEVVEGRPDPTEPLFPNCVAFDEDPWLQGRGRLVDDQTPDLHELACNLQAAMFSKSERAYRLDDVCAVLGGMAMSHLHLLEGMSGIGKTSLPKALATALGTACEVIEVQAGWRDKHDLFGHYNTFERRFQEEPFLLALYKAQTPRYADRPFFIVLDEMNLSRPEQYFSMLLSKLENNQGHGGEKEPIRLAPVGNGRKPSLMDENGTGIFLPDNVWFVGTANQDESTLGFADKTYNRSFVLELPAKRPFVPDKGRTEPYSAGALERAFEQAKKLHAVAYQRVKSLLDALEDDLHEVARIHLDPRVTAQLERFVPVAVAARGTEAVNETGRGPFKIKNETVDPVALAADQFIASKVLHQLRSRFEVTTEGLHHLESALVAYWPDRFEGTTPDRCLRVFSDEHRRRHA